MLGPNNERGQMLLAEEYFAAENDLFLETLRRANQPKPLAGFTDRWKKDPRPWARQQILKYLAQPLNCPGHQPVVKRLFKNAEENNDHEVMAAFMVAFDFQVRRQIRVRRHWDRQSRSIVEEDRLATPRDVIPSKQDRLTRNPVTGEMMSFLLRGRPLAKLFSYRTRYYLRRRAWRYFRYLGFRKPADYVPAVVRALAAYDDEHLQRGENILDSWSLLHACFGEHDALDIGATHIRLKNGRTLSELAPAPAFAETWKKPEAAQLVLSLAVDARARLVRMWAMQLFQRDHPNHVVPLETVVNLLDHPDAEIQQFGAKLLERLAELDTLPVTSWLRLLQTKNEEALQRICDAFAKHVSGNRLELAQCIELSCQRAVPVARLGQRYLKERTITTPADRDQIVGLANAKCRAVTGELASWALKILGTKEHYACDQVIRFFDSTLQETREAAWTWLEADSPALTDPMLWSRLAETPYDDIRLQVIDFLQRHTKLPGADADKLENIWRSVLLGVHRGGRQKAKAVQQIAHAIVENPTRSEMLLPVLAVAVRSVRGPEARAGLAAVVSIMEALPQLAEAAQRLLPEMKILEKSA